jgi:hypothetical protein
MALGVKGPGKLRLTCRHFGAHCLRRFELTARCVYHCRAQQKGMQRVEIEARLVVSEGDEVAQTFDWS